MNRQKDEQYNLEIYQIDKGQQIFICDIEQLSGISSINQDDDQMNLDTNNYQNFNDSDQDDLQLFQINKNNQNKSSELNEKQYNRNNDDQMQIKIDQSFVQQESQQKNQQKQQKQDKQQNFPFNAGYGSFLNQMQRLTGDIQYENEQYDIYNDTNQTINQNQNQATNPYNQFKQFCFQNKENLIKIEQELVIDFNEVEQILKDKKLIKQLQMELLKLKRQKLNFHQFFYIKIDPIKNNKQLLSQSSLKFVESQLKNALQQNSEEKQLIKLNNNDNDNIFNYLIQQDQSHSTKIFYHQSKISQQQKPLKSKGKSKSKSKKSQRSKNKTQKSDHKQYPISSYSMLINQPFINDSQSKLSNKTKSYKQISTLKKLTKIQSHSKLAKQKSLQTLINSNDENKIFKTKINKNRKEYATKVTQLERDKNHYVDKLKKRKTSSYQISWGKQKQICKQDNNNNNNANSKLSTSKKDKNSQNKNGYLQQHKNK